jgi:hypothetical protein
MALEQVSSSGLSEMLYEQGRGAMSLLQSRKTRTSKKVLARW